MAVETTPTLRGSDSRGAVAWTELQATTLACSAFVMLLSSHRSFEIRAECVTLLFGFHSLNKWLTPLANIGVLVGLAVLILEIRQNNELTLAQIEQTRSESLLQWRGERVLNDHVAPIIAKARQIMLEVSDKPVGEMSASERQAALEKALEKFDSVERVRAQQLLIRSLWDFETLYFQYNRGLVSESYWNERIVPAIISDAPGWKAATGVQFEELGRREFRDEIERVLSTTE